MNKKVLVLGTCLMTGFLSGCVIRETNYVGVGPAISPAYMTVGLGFGGAGIYANNPYWGIGMNDWYSPGMYYGPSIYAYDW